MSGMYSEFLEIQNSPTAASRAGDGIGLAGYTVEFVLSLPRNSHSDALVLFLPFIGGSARIYTHVIKSLAEQYPNTVYLALSYPGTGALTGRTSQRTAEDDNPEKQTVIPRTEQVFAILRSSRIAEFWAGTGTGTGTGTGIRKLVIVAQSMSAKISYLLLDLLANERDVTGGDMNIDVMGLVLLGPAPIGPLHFSPEMREQQVHAYDDFESAKWTVENVLTHKKLDVELVGVLARDCVVTSDGAKAGWMDYGMVFDCSEYVGRLHSNWPMIKVRVVVGEYDKVESVESVRRETVVVLRDLGIDVGETVIKEAGHLLPIEAVNDVAAEVSSLINV